jgi:mannose-6-phosphate isomerase-like protein (cupin superfamily)
MADKAKPGEIWTSERCYIKELLNDPALPDVSVARTRVEPDVTTELHSLDILEVYVIETGRGLMRVGDAAPWPVGPGDTVAIPENAPQQITNCGDSDLVFHCVCVPRFRPACYTSLEPSGKHR